MAILSVQLTTGNEEMEKHRRICWEIYKLKLPEKEFRGLLAVEREKVDTTFKSLSFESRGDFLIKLRQAEIAEKELNA